MRTASEPPLSMPLAQALAERSLVRNFRPDAPSPARIRTLMQAAVCAPTAIHAEPRAFAVVQDRALLRRISDRAKPLFLDELQRVHVEREGPGTNPLADPDFDIFHNAPTLIVVCGLSAAPLVEADCWLAAGNLLLAAHADGLGACVIGAAIPVLNLEQIKRELDIPRTYTPVAPIIVGFAAAPGIAGSGPAEPRILCWK